MPHRRLWQTAKYHARCDRCRIVLVAALRRSVEAGDDCRLTPRAAHYHHQPGAFLDAHRVSRRSNSYCPSHANRRATVAVASVSIRSVYEPLDSSGIHSPCPWSAGSPRGSLGCVRFVWHHSALPSANADYETPKRVRSEEHTSELQ